MLHNICGRAKSGKTEYLFRLCEQLIKEKKHTFLIVPEQGAVLAERQVIQRLGNRSNEYIEVINFKRLCNRVFRETGGLTQSYVDPAHKLLVMYRALCEVREFLVEYKGASEVTGFVKKAVDTVSEFRMYGVTPKMLEKSADVIQKGGNTHLSMKLRDFALIYAQYNSMLTETFGYHDSSDDLDRLCSVLKDYGFFKGKTVIIDSFYGFTVPELNVIECIIDDAEDVYISYLYDGTDNLLFRRGAKAYERINRKASGSKGAQDVYPGYENGYEAGGLAALEKSFAFEIIGAVPPAEKSSDGSVRVISCADPYEEAKMAAAAVRYFTGKCGARYSEIAICARSAESYAGILDTELRRNGIPFGFSVRYDLLTRPVSAYIMAAFEFSRHKSKQSVLRLIKTGLTGLTDREADLTECYIRTWNIQGRMFTDGEWLMNPDGYTSVSEMSERARHTLETVERAREKLITPLVVFDEEIRSAECANEISAAIIKLLESSRYNAKALNAEEIVYHNLVMDALDCIADVMGNEKVSPKVYAALFEMILTEFDTGRIPATVDEVNIADAELMRSGATSYMILLGATNGEFPRMPKGNGIFSDREKGLLSECGIELSQTGIDEVFDELFLAYKALTTPSKGLIVTFSERNAVGEEAGGSEIVRMCLSAVPGLSTERAKDAADIRFCLCDASLLSDALDASEPELSRAVSAYLEKKGIDLNRYSDIYQEYLKPETAKEIFGSELILSPSRLDKFNYCACSYFARYTLALNPEPVAALGPGESGTIIHRILELLIAELAEKKANGESITAEYALAREKELLNLHINELLGGEEAKKRASKRFRYLYERLSGALDACVTVMAGEFSNSDFLPTDFETSIGGSDADIPFASIPVTDGDGNQTGTLTVRGKIDRTDIYKKDGKVYIKVIDYKTGHKKFNLNDVAAGINLQMLLYLHSLSENGAVRYGEGKAIPAGVVYTPIRRPSLSSQLGDDIGEGAVSAFKPNGILIDDREILTAMDRSFSGSYVPVKLKQDGSYASSSSITSLETMGRLLSTAAGVAAKLAREIQSGKIARNPYKSKSINSCSMCDFQAFCRYKSGDEGTRYTETSYSDEVFTKSI